MSKVSNQPISDKLKRLDAMLEWFDSDEFELEQAIDKYHEAESLAAELEQDLAGLKNEINVLKQKFDA